MAVKSGDATWQSTPNLQVDWKTGSVTLSDTKSFGARLGTSRDFKTLVLMANLRLGSANPDNGVVSVGFGVAPSLGNPTFGGIGLFFEMSGKYRCIFTPDPADWRMKNGTIWLGGGTIPNFDPNEPVVVKLSFDRSLRILDATMNGEPAFKVDLSEKKIDPECTFAGFSGYGFPVNVPIIKAFEIKMSP